MLTADGVHVDVLKNDVNLSAVGPYFLGINFTDMTVSIVLIRIVCAVFLSHCLKTSCTCQSAVTVVGFIFRSVISTEYSSGCRLWF